MGVWKPKRFRPSHLRVVALEWAGLDNLEIANRTGYSVQHVSNILTTPEAEEIRIELRKNTLDTMTDIQLEVQAIAPTILHEKIRLAINANDERVRSTSCTDLLHMAGHSPVKRLQLEKIDKGDADLADKSEDELRSLVRDEMDRIKSAGAPASGDPTLH